MMLRLPSVRTLAVALTFSLLAGCSSKKSPPAPFVGMAWTAGGNNVTATHVRNEKTGNKIELIGAHTTSAFSSAGVDLRNVPMAVGSYTFLPSTGYPDELLAAYVEVNSASSNIFFSNSGNVTVSSVTATHIAGTFHYVATDPSSSSPDSRTITNGKFNIAL